MSLLLWLAACTCSEPPAPDPGLSAPGHFSGFDGLVRAVARSDLQASRELARDLSSGPVDDDHPGASKVGAAIGFVQVADTPDELPLAIARAASGCGACHVELGVPAPEPPAFAHAAVARRAVFDVVWGLDEALPEAQPFEAGIREAWGADDRVTAVLEACQGCHS